MVLVAFAVGATAPPCGVSSLGGGGMTPTGAAKRPRRSPLVVGECTRVRSSLLRVSVSLQEREMVRSVERMRSGGRRKEGEEEEEEEIGKALEVLEGEGEKGAPGPAEQKKDDGDATGSAASANANGNVEVAPIKSNSWWEYLWPRALLTLVSFLYGTNFAVVKLLDESVRDSSSAALRFSLAALALLPSLNKAPRPVVTEGLRIGLFVFTGYFFQAVALETTESNKIAFLSALAVVFVPLLTFFLPSEEKGKKAEAPLLSVALAVLGVGLLELGGSSAPSIGDLEGLLQGLLFSCGFVFNERVMAKYPGSRNAMALSGAQLLTIGVCSVLWYIGDSTLLYGGFDIQGLTVTLSDPLVVASLLYTGLITTALSIALENTALSKVSASELSLLFSTEPFFAAAFSAFLIDESLSSRGVVGGVLIIAACLVGPIRNGLRGSFGKIVGGVSKWLGLHKSKDS